MLPCNLSGQLIYASNVASPVRTFSTFPLPGTCKVDAKQFSMTGWCRSRCQSFACAVIGALFILWFQAVWFFVLFIVKAKHSIKVHLNGISERTAILCTRDVYVAIRAYIFWLPRIAHNTRATSAPDRHRSISRLLQGARRPAFVCKCMDLHMDFVWWWFVKRLSSICI